jgi:hypothetical protein
MVTLMDDNVDGWEKALRKDFCGHTNDVNTWVSFRITFGKHFESLITYAVHLR